MSLGLLSVRAEAMHVAADKAELFPSRNQTCLGLSANRFLPSWLMQAEVLSLRADCSKLS